MSLLVLRVQIPPGEWWVLSGTGLCDKLILPTVVCHSVWSRNLEHEYALPAVGLLRQKKLTDSVSSYVYYSVEAMKACSGRSMAPTILNLGTRWKWVQHHAPSALPQGYGPSISLKRRLCGPWTRCGLFLRTVNLLLRPGLEPWAFQSTASCCTEYALYNLQTIQAMVERVFFLLF